MKNFVWLALLAAGSFVRAAPLPDSNFILNTSSPNLTTTKIAVPKLDISTLSISSLNISTLNISTLNISTLNISTLNISTLNISTLNISTLNISTLNISTLNISTLNISTLNISTLNFSNPRRSNVKISNTNVNIFNGTAATRSNITVFPAENNKVFTPQPDDPENPRPVNVLGLDPGRTMNCEGDIFTYDEIYDAIWWADNLEFNDPGHPVYRGRPDGIYPEGRFPHSYQDALSFTCDPSCPADNDRMEYPLIHNGPYNGGKNNINWGPHRVIFYSMVGEIDWDTTYNQRHFCGGLTHKNAQEKGAFVQCTIS